MDIQLLFAATGLSALFGLAYFFGRSEGRRENEHELVWLRRQAAFWFFRTNDLCNEVDELKDNMMPWDREAYERDKGD